jgi:hypothetical protein
MDVANDDNVVGFKLTEVLKSFAEEQQASLSSPPLPTFRTSPLTLLCPQGRNMSRISLLPTHVVSKVESPDNYRTLLHA